MTWIFPAVLLMYSRGVADEDKRKIERWSWPISSLVFNIGRKIETATLKLWRVDKRRIGSLSVLNKTIRFPIKQQGPFDL